VHREDDGRTLGQLVQHGGDAVEGLRVVHVGGPVQRDHDVLARRQAVAARHVERLRARQVHPQGVDHDVAHAHDTVSRLALSQQVGVAVGRGREQQRGDAVGDDAVDLLGHVPVARAQAGLGMHHRDVQLGGHQRGRHGGVHVAHHVDQARLTRLEHLLQPHHHRRGLGGVRARAHAQVLGGARHAQVIEEDLAHRVVVVLARVDDVVVDAACHEGRVDRRGLHEVRTGTDDREAWSHFDRNPGDPGWSREGFRPVAPTDAPVG
jgi:hypothetical protein